LTDPDTSPYCRNRSSDRRRCTASDLVRVSPRCSARAELASVNSTRACPPISGVVIGLCSTKTLPNPVRFFDQRTGVRIEQRAVNFHRGKADVQRADQMRDAGIERVQKDPLQPHINPGAQDDRLDRQHGPFARIGAAYTADREHHILIAGPDAHRFLNPRRAVAPAHPQQTLQNDPIAALQIAQHACRERLNGSAFNVWMNSKLMPSVTVRRDRPFCTVPARSLAAQDARRKTPGAE
jgi:hypothetical protein